MIKQFFLLTFLLSCGSLSALEYPPKYFDSEETAKCYMMEHYNLGFDYYNQQAWSDAADQFERILYFFPNSEMAAKLAFYLGVCYYEMKDYDFANNAFSTYLKASQHPEFFQESVYYKFCIAEHFKAGRLRRPFTYRYFPKCLSAKDYALTVYDEVVAALPNQELALQALLSKADLLRSMEEFRDAVETYQLIIRRFPRHEAVPQCYVEIAETYYQQSQWDYQNPDIIALAELNARKFKNDFPREERVELAEEKVADIKELYAQGLCDLGDFYKRTKQPYAAAIYYQSAIEEFPDTQVAECCRNNLETLDYSCKSQKPCDEDEE